MGGDRWGDAIEGLAAIRLYGMYFKGRILGYVVCEISRKIERFYYIAKPIAIDFSCPLRLRVNSRGGGFTGTRVWHWESSSMSPNFEDKSRASRYFVTKVRECGPTKAAAPAGGVPPPPAGLIKK